MDIHALVSVALRLALVMLLVLANGFFVAAEFSLVSIRRSRVASLVAGGDRRARRLLRIIENLNEYISATQTGVTIASLALGWVGEAAIAELLGPIFERLLSGTSALVAAHSIAIALSFAAITCLHIVLGELVPKTVALARTERVAFLIAPPLEMFYRVFRLPIWLLNRAGVKVLGWIGLGESAEHTAAYSEEELRHLVALSHKSGHLLEDERQLIYNIFDFTDATIESVMVPRTEIEALDLELTPAEMLDVFEKTGYSRMPVYRDSLDNVTGIILLKDLTQLVRHASTSIEQILRPPVFLPTTMRLNDALRSLRRSSEHMAMVVDEHGGVEGLVTLDDLLEELVGEIRDEHDETAVRQIVEQPDGSFRVSGLLSIRDANKVLGLGLPESDSYHTIAGFMLARAGRLLRSHESVEYNDLRITVESTVRNRIVEARIERLKVAQEAEPSLTA
jgi:magnesium and cobalt exporter, CNNM family